MDEGLDVKVVGDVRADVAHGLQIHFAREHDTPRAKLIQRVRREVIRDARLRRHVQLEFRRDPMREHHDADVGDDERVDAGAAQVVDVRFDRRDLIVPR